MTAWDIALRLTLACLMGAAIGIERESLGRPAGLRTYTLVCVGSCLAMIISLYMGFQYGHIGGNTDPGRIAAQVISGIGFLGAGTILRDGNSISGLTTAAGLWVAACIGLAVGAGLYVPAIVCTVLVLVVLLLFVKVEEKYSGLRQYKKFIVISENKFGQIGRYGTSLGDLGILIKNISMDNSSEEQLELQFTLQVPSGMCNEDVVGELIRIEGTKSVEHS